MGEKFCNPYIEQGFKNPHYMKYLYNLVKKKNPNNPIFKVGRIPKYFSKGDIKMSNRHVK